MTPSTVAKMESAYDTLAQAIDQAGPRSEVFLVKLALLMVHEWGDAEAFERLVALASQDLDVADKVPDKLAEPRR